MVGTSSALDRTTCCIAAVLAGTKFWQASPLFYKLVAVTLRRCRPRCTCSRAYSGRTWRSVLRVSGQATTPLTVVMPARRECVFTAGVKGQPITIVVSDRDLLAHNCLLGIAVSEVCRSFWRTRPIDLAVQVMCSQQVLNTVMTQSDVDEALAELRPRVKESMDKVFSAFPFCSPSLTSSSLRPSKISAPNTFGGFVVLSSTNPVLVGSGGGTGGCNGRLGSPEAAIQRAHQRQSATGHILFALFFRGAQGQPPRSGSLLRFGFVSVAVRF